MLARSKAFSLIELLAVIALVGLVVATLLGFFSKLKARSNHQLNTQLVCNLLTTGYQHYKVTYGEYPEGLTAEEPNGFRFDTPTRVQALDAALCGHISSINPQGIPFVHLPVYVQTRGTQGQLIALSDPDNPGCFECYQDGDGDGWVHVCAKGVFPGRVIFIYKVYDND